MDFIRIYVGFKSEMKRKAHFLDYYNSLDDEKEKQKIFNQDVNVQLMKVQVRSMRYFEKKGWIANGEPENQYGDEDEDEDEIRVVEEKEKEKEKEWDEMDLEEEQFEEFDLTYLCEGDYQLSLKEEEELVLLLTEGLEIIEGRR
jgi:hypothetical protein